MPTTVTEPTPLMSDNGIILSVGIVANGDRAEIVMPMASDTALDPITGCGFAVEAFGSSGIRDGLMDLLSSGAWMSFVQAVGMTNGALIPARADFGSTDHVGTRAAGPMPSRVGAIGVFYGNPGQPSPEHRIRVGKQFFPGIAQGDVVGDVITNTLRDLIEAWCVKLCDGTLAHSGGTTFYRVTAADSEPASSLCNTVIVNARNYIATVARRTLPH